ncbi:MAG TPA: GNAT family N-acetyltransferase [Solirubrobacteraceae bacterium]|nr:GNAT family N-acetyltransferase [Solirubrobacteraceae bacterium]
MRIVAFEPAHTAACVAVMASNAPEFFAEEEVADFERFLAELPGTYLVVLDDDEVVACGGFDVDAEGVAVLTWGMVRRDLHRGGLGSLLLRERLDRIAADPRAHRVRMDTSQHSRPFFERFGFVVTKHTPGGYAPGLDRYDMALEL